MPWKTLSEWGEFAAVLAVGLGAGVAIGWNAGRGTRDEGLKGAFEYSQERWLEAEREADYYRRELSEHYRGEAADLGVLPETLPPQGLPLTVEEALELPAAAEGGAR
jgi:hypothetical protein